TALRLVITETHQDIARVKELCVWPPAVDGIPPLGTAVKNWHEEALFALVPLIYLNQSGFNLAAPKRFTAPTLPDGTPFAILPAEGEEPVHEGVLENHIGDFSSFQPDTRREWVVHAGEHRSFPFTIAPWLLEQNTYQGALDFMIDSRHYVGTHTKTCVGSFGWRDDHYFGWELSTLVPQLLSNPTGWTSLKQQITYQKPDERQLWGALEPYPADAPDIVKLIHWGADVALTQKLTHQMLKSELAYFLYAWPVLSQWLPEQNYQAVSDYVFANWERSDTTREIRYDLTPPDGHNLLETKTIIGGTKGGYPPGFSLEPNLLLHQVALREKRADAPKYLDAARRQLAWMVAELDWEDPLTTKGQRMSEHRTIPGMVLFHQLHPELVPEGFAEKITAWVGVAIRRSENLWDFRKLTDEGDWVPSGERATMWNEPGNLLGFPACAIPAKSLVSDPELRQRLDELIWANLDNAWGRNPTGRHFSFDATREFPGTELGWFSFHKGGIGQLEDARFVFDGSPKKQHYPYHPEVGNVGWSEGWIQHNTAFNLSLAHLAMDRSRLSLRNDGDELLIELHAPIFPAEGPARPTVQLHSAQTESQSISLSPDPQEPGRFTARMPRPAGALSAAYGHGCYATRAQLP
ncbi:MAG: discoidin domain-containing protein, partial [Verrucomicrobiales bacterium]